MNDPILIPDRYLDPEILILMLLFLCKIFVTIDEARSWSVLTVLPPGVRSVLGAHPHRVREEVAWGLRGLGASLRQADTAGGRRSIM